LNKEHFLKVMNQIKKLVFINLDKELFLENLLKNIDKNSKIISSTGFNSREINVHKK
jgi:hypothetical protein